MAKISLAAYFDLASARNVPFGIMKLSTSRKGIAPSSNNFGSFFRRQKLPGREKNHKVTKTRKYLEAM
jgi:hypothetical protein